MKEISIREFAKRMKCADSAIRKAIQNGVISEGYDSKKKKILYQKAKKEWEARSAHAKKSELDKKQTTKSTQLNAFMTLAEATRLSKIYEAKKRELEVAELEGVLVRKEYVYKELLQAGQEIRSALQTIPDKFIDNILACSNRSEAHSVLYSAITEALQGLHFKNVKI